MEPSDRHARFVQQARWTESARRHLYERVRMKPGGRVLDVGCGTGALHPELSAAGQGVFGIDLNTAYLTYAMNRTDARLAAADGYALPFSGRTFDVCLCHFLLLWTKRPREILKEMMRVTRPGGAVLALAEPDYGGRLDFPLELQRLGALQAEALITQGADACLGRRLRALLAEAGLQDVAGGVLGGEWAAPPREQDWEMEWRVLQEDLGPRLTAQEWQALRRLDRNAWGSRQRVLYVPTFYGYGFVLEKPD